MGHSEVMKWFESYFPDFQERDWICGFQMEGTVSVSARKMAKNLYSLITVRKDWKFETITSFLNGMKGEKK